MRTLWLLHEMGLDFELVVHEFGKGLRSPEYRAINPAGRVPGLVHNGNAIMESGAMTQYLCETFPTALHRAQGDKERCDWLQWLHYSETLGQSLVILTQQHIVIYEDSDRSPLLMSLERRRLEKLLQHLDTHLANQDFLLSSGFSAVDTNFGYCVHVARHFTPLSEVPNVAAYYARISERPAFQKSLPPKGAARIYTKEFYSVLETG